MRRKNDYKLVHGQRLIDNLSSELNLWEKYGRCRGGNIGVYNSAEDIERLMEMIAW